VAYEKIFTCEVLTPAGKAMSAEAVSAIVPLVDGLLGVLADRAPLIAEVGAGLLAVEEKGGARHEYFVAGGFANVRDNTLSILAEECEPIEKLDPGEADRLLQEAQSLPAENDAEKHRRRQATAVASARLNAANKK